MNEKISYFLSYLQKYSGNEEKLREFQIKDAKKIVLRDGFSYPPSTIAGIDAAYINNTAYTACVTLNFKNLKILEEKVITTELKFHYKPGFFIFREGPPTLDILLKLKIVPDVILINSHGISHPLGIGAASHIGILIQKSTIGVAQNILCGNVELPKKKGNCSPINYKNKIVGYAFLSQINSKPIFISPGHLISLETSIKIIKNTIKAHKLPEPIRLAHQLANLSKSQQLI
ncbi:MAG: endonuclease V [Candidatus Helarchaeota archaeon]|nr:endonuclease V [Candidatus Helarchaeota archaeon]